MDKKYVNITWETPDTVIEGTPVSEIPKEIKDYYFQNYDTRTIPFSAKTIKEIAAIIYREDK